LGRWLPGAMPRGRDDQDTQGFNILWFDHLRTQTRPAIAVFGPFRARPPAATLFLPAIGSKVTFFFRLREKKYFFGTYCFSFFTTDSFFVLIFENSHDDVMSKAGRAVPPLVSPTGPGAGAPLGVQVMSDRPSPILADRDASQGSTWAGGLRPSRARGIWEWVASPWDALALPRGGVVIKTMMMNGTDGNLL